MTEGDVFLSQFVPVHLGQSDLTFVQIIWLEEINIPCIANMYSLLITIFILSCNCSEKKLLVCYCVVSSLLNQYLPEDLVIDTCMFLSQPLGQLVFGKSRRR